jgi:hypothetical protein
MRLTFAEHGDVDFDEFAIEAEYGLEMALDDVSREVGD